MELYLFRHGEKEKSDFFVGQTDVLLTAKGLLQNEQTAKKLVELNVEKIFTSDLQRTFVVGAIKQQALREINFGLWEGLSWKEIEQKFLQEALMYLQHPLDFCFPQGENYSQFRARILGFINALRNEDFKRVGIVAHQGVIKTILSEWRTEDFWKLKVDYGQMVKLYLP